MQLRTIVRLYCNAMCSKLYRIVNFEDINVATIMLQVLFNSFIYQPNDRIIHLTNTILSLHSTCPICPNGYQQYD